MAGSLRLLGIAGASLVLGVLAACAAPTSTDDAAGASSAATAAAFDRNNVLDDKWMRDATTVSAGDLQKLLEKTPWGTASGLATFTENGKTAAQIMTDAAVAHGINPLEMLVRVQMEQGLVSKTTAPAATVAIAFGCGCPDSSACSSKYMGFTNQAECAAGTMSRSMDAAVTDSGTVSGWARSKAKATLDSVTVTPVNATTAALYTYTPYVGESGGGKAGVGGVSLHFQVWNRFATFTSYGPWGATSASDPSADAGTSDPDASIATPDASAPSVDAGDPTDPSDDAGVDAGAPTTTADAGPPPDDGSDDSAILSGGNATPSSNSPPPTGTVPTKPTELTPATDAELAGSPKSTGGCSTSGPRSPSNLLLGAAVALSLLIARRRRR